MGKATVALELAKAVNCCRRDPEAGTDEIDGCDDCEACERIAEGSFPYLGVVFPTSKALEKEIERQIRRRQEGPPAADEQEEPELELIEIEGAEIHIDRVREMLQNASLKAPTGVRKIYLIVSVEKMNFVAENHFLKVLEEPAPRE